MIDGVLEYIMVQGMSLYHIREGEQTRCGIRLKPGGYNSFINHYSFVDFDEVCSKCNPEAPTTWRLLPPYVIHAYVS